MKHTWNTLNLKEIPLLLDSARQSLQKNDPFDRPLLAWEHCSLINKLLQ